MYISHKIELIPNKIGREYFAKAFGCARLAYNWGLSRWKELREQGINRNALAIKKDFSKSLENQNLRVYVEDNFIGIGRYIDGAIKLKKVFYEG